MESRFVMFIKMLGPPRGVNIQRIYYMEVWLYSNSENIKYKGGVGIS